MSRGQVPGVAEFGEFYDRYSAAVLVFFARRTWDAQAAMDLTAETFAQAFAGRGSFRGGSEEELAGWLFGIARHQLARFFRGGRAERSAIERLGVRMPDVAADDLERIEQLAGLYRLRGTVAEEMKRLSSEQREALALRVVDELSYDVIAQRLGVSEQTARKRVSRGLRKLADALDGALPAEGQIT
jgi:RNA polymerase sigma factor (sigma-70 family)